MRLVAAAAIITAAGYVSPALGGAAFLIALAGAIALGIHRGTVGTPVTVRQMPSAYQRRQGRKGRWVPGAGLGVAFWQGGIRPLLYLTIWRRR